MKSDGFSLLYYSGTDLNDYEPQWFEEHSTLYCSTCHVMLPQAHLVNIDIIGKIPKNNGMFFIGHTLIPYIISEELYKSLDDIDQYLEKSEIHSKINENFIRQPFFACKPKFDLVVLRGENPDIFMGKPVPEDERIHVCPECGRRDRRERSPLYLFENEKPMHAISGSLAGIIVDNSVIKRIDKRLLKAVRVEKIAIKPPL